MRPSPPTRHALDLDGPTSPSSAGARSPCLGRSRNACACSSHGTRRVRRRRSVTRSFAALARCVPRGRSIFPATERTRADVLVVMKRGATQKEIDAVVARIQEFGIQPVPLPGAERMAIGTFGSTSRAAADAVEALPGVAEVIPTDTVVRVDGVPIGGDAPLAIMAGPCSVESREQTLATARAVRAAGATVLRGGAFKPRSSPYTFRGL